MTTTLEPDLVSTGVGKVTMITPSIRLEGITLQYQTKTLFEDLSASIHGSEWSVVLGRSGVGKTSLLRLIAGLSADATGQVSASDHLPLENRIAYLNQHASLMPWLSVIDNVLLGYTLRGEKTTALRDKALNLLEHAGLANNANQKPLQLSGGMKQRVALVRTLMEDKPIGLLDEPFSALDAITRLHIQNLAADLLRNRTVLLITHDPLEALRLGQHIYVLSGAPAYLQRMTTPSGSIPRSATDVDLLCHEAELIAALSQGEQL